MKNSYRFILIILSALIISGGALLLGFQGTVLNYMQAQTGLSVALTPVHPIVSASDSLDPTILQSPTFIGLVNNVVNFNFDNICWRPDTVSQAIVPVSVTTVGGDSTLASSTVPASPLNCVQGNGLPFIVKTSSH